MVNIYVFESKMRRSRLIVEMANNPTLKSLPSLAELTNGAVLNDEAAAAVDGSVLDDPMHIDDEDVGEGDGKKSHTDSQVSADDAVAAADAPVSSTKRKAAEITNSASGADKATNSVPAKAPHVAPMETNGSSKAASKAVSAKRTKK